MKRYFQAVLLSVIVLMAVGCNDDLSSVGGSISPDGDKAFVETDTFQIEVATVPMGAIFARTHLPLLGSYTDPVFGEIEADFMTEFFCPDDFKLTFKPTYNRLDSIVIAVYYPSYTGADLAPQQASLYRLNKQLEKNFYSDVDPADFYSPSDLLAVKSYTAKDLSVSDSIRNTKDYTGSIRFLMSEQFTNEIYGHLKDNPTYFSSAESFKKNVLKGVYVKNTFGKGSLLNVGFIGINDYSPTSNAYLMEMYLYYRYTKSRAEDNKPDTILKASSVIPVTELSVQCNRFKSGNFDMTDPKMAYLQSPAGQMMELSFPIGKIIKKMPKDAYINSMKYQFTIGSPTFGGTKLKPPHYVMLVRKDKLKDFFEKREVISSTNSTYYAVYDSTTYTYNFGNIASLLNNEIEDRKDKETLLDEDEVLKMVAVPVSLGFEVVGNSSTMVSVSHNFMPSGIRIKKVERNGIWGHSTPIVFTRFNSQKRSTLPNSK